MRTRTSLALLFCLACPADLSRFEIGADGSVPRVDGGGPRDGALPDLDATTPSDADTTPRDAGVDECGLPPTCTDGCPLPWLLASVEDLQPADACGGRVLRWSLTSRTEACVCPALGRGLLELPFAVGFLPPSTVVAVEQDGSVYALDGNTDRELWNDVSTSGDRLVTDVFPIADPSGAPHVAVAYQRRGTSSINEVVVYDPSGTERETWTGSSLPGGAGIASITLSSYADRRFRAVKPNGGFAAAEIDPWTGTVISTPYHTLSRDGFFLLTISALYWDGNHRTVWTGRRTDVTPERSQVYSLRSVIPSEDNRVPLGDQCDTAYMRGLAYDATCTFIHAVPSPLHDTDSFAICETSPGERRVVRLQHINGECADLAQDTRLFPRARFSKLAIALPRYQPE